MTAQRWLVGGLHAGRAPADDAASGFGSDTAGGGSPIVPLGDPNTLAAAASLGVQPGFDRVWGTLGAPAPQDTDDWLNGSVVMDDFYKKLQVDSHAESEVIRAAFCALTRKHHPDGGGDTQRMVEFNAAWAVLGDPLLRSAYDAERDRPSAPAVNGAGAALLATRDSAGATGCHEARATPALSSTSAAMWVARSRRSSRATRTISSGWFGRP